MQWVQAVSYSLSPIMERKYGDLYAESNTSEGTYATGLS